jgi:hypothetical protein
MKIAVKLLKRRSVSLMQGAGSVLDLIPATSGSVILGSLDTDALAIQSDWVKVEKDLGAAFNKAIVDEQKEEITHRPLQAA